jgi:hypothetical protein
MGSGTWSRKDFDSYTRTTKGYSAASYSVMDSLSTQDIFKSRSLHPDLDPKGVMRECCDSDEHPNTFPVILALDVTGSMGNAAVKTAQKLNDIMTELYADEEVPDIEFCVMGIGDCSCDSYPIQMSQFESDIRIAEQLDQIYFEFGGGGNKYESYTAAWYMGSRHCKLDCWNRGQKGLIITMGDELPNPYIPIESYRGGGLKNVTGDPLQGNVETKDLLPEVLEKFDVYHISIDDDSSSYEYHKRYDIDEEWTALLGDHYQVCTLDNLPKAITDIVLNNTTAHGTGVITVNENSEVTW